MRSSLFNLILGVVWLGLWLYRAFFVLIPDGQVPMALIELAIVCPLGLGGVLDWLLYGRRGGKSFIHRPAWTPSDFLFFATGALGSLALLLSPFFRWIKSDLALMGGVALAVGVVHYFRRRIYMSKARAEGSQEP